MAAATDGLTAVTLTAGPGGAGVPACGIGAASKETKTEHSAHADKADFRSENGEPKVKEVIGYGHFGDGE